MIPKYEILPSRPPLIQERETFAEYIMGQIRSLLVALILVSIGMGCVFLAFSN